MTITLSKKFADFTLKWNADEKRSYESLVYQYAVLINFLSIVLLTVAIGLANGRLTATLTAGAAFMLLRMVSGGYHFKSLDLCAVVTAAIYGAIPFLHVSGGVLTIINVISVILVAYLAPTNLRNTLWTSSKRAKNVFKAVAIVIVLSAFVFDSATVSLAFLAQALLLIPKREVNSQ